MSALPQNADAQTGEQNVAKLPVAETRLLGTLTHRCFTLLQAPVTPCHPPGAAGRGVDPPLPRRGGLDFP